MNPKSLPENQKQMTKGSFHYILSDKMQKVFQNQFNIMDDITINMLDLGDDELDKRKKLHKAKAGLLKKDDLLDYLIKKKERTFGSVAFVAQLI